MSATTTEFDVIRDYFTHALSRSDVSLGVGDDCAIVTPPAGQQLAMTVDTLVSGVHFPVSSRPADIAYKSVAVSLSDLAAMGARPAWLTLALTLPEVETEWLNAFAGSFYRICHEHGVQLIGGDTTRGPLAISVQATGFLQHNRVMRRDSARPDDLVYVSGPLGDAALGLKILTDDKPVEDSIYASCVGKLNRPVPRVEFAVAATEFCRCAIDVSDGLLADLGHITEASHCGADIQLEQIPLSPELKAYFAEHGDRDGEIDWSMVLAGGDDYELCMTVCADNEQGLLQLASNMQIPLSCIGKITGGDKVSVKDASGRELMLDDTGYEHFSQDRDE